MSHGLILPPGSPAVQFELRRTHRGHTEAQKEAAKKHLPTLVWVDRRGEPKKSQRVCPDCPTVWRVLESKFGTGNKNGYYCVCLCEGRFIE